MPDVTRNPCGPRDRRPRFFRLPLRLAAALVPILLTPHGHAAAQEPPPSNVRVVDTEGGAVADAHVEFWSSESAVDAADIAMAIEIAKGRTPPRRGPRSPIATATTAPDGICRLQLKQGAGWLVATTADGRTSGWIAAQPGASGSEQVLVVAERCFVEGLVLDPAGEPVADAIVELTTTDGPSAAGQPAVPKTIDPARTGADGRFLALVDADAQITLRATASGIRTEQRRVRTEPGRRVRIALRSLGTARLVVTLVDAQGDVVIGGVARAVATPPPDADDPWPERFDSSATETRGRYEIALPGPGGYAVRATGPGIASNSPVEVLVPADGPVPELEVIVPDPVSIRGRLLTQAGLPLREFALITSVRDQSLPWEVDGLERRTTFPRRVLTDFDGTFEVTMLHPEFTYDLRAEREDGELGFLVASGVRGAAREQDFTVPTELLVGATVRVQLDTPRDARAPTKAECDLWQRDGDRWRRALDSAPSRVEGRTITLERMEAGAEYVIVVRTRGFAPARYGPWSCRRFTSEIGIRLVRPGGILVRVLDAKGEPVAGAAVSVRTETGFPFFGPPSEATTDGRGFARFRGLPPGRGEVSAALGALGSAPRVVRILSRDETDLVLRLR